MINILTKAFIQSVGLLSIVLLSTQVMAETRSGISSSDGKEAIMDRGKQGKASANKKVPKKAISTMSQTNTSYTTVRLTRHQKLRLTNGIAIIRSSSDILQVIEMNAVVGSYKNARVLKDRNNGIWVQTSKGKLKKGTFLRIESNLKTANKTVSKNSASNTYKTIKLSSSQKLLLTNGIAIIRSAKGVVQVIEMNGSVGAKYLNAKILKDSKNAVWLEANRRKLKKGSYLRIENMGSIKRLGSKVFMPYQWPRTLTPGATPVTNLSTAECRHLEGSVYDTTVCSSSKACRLIVNGQIRRLCITQ